MTLNKLDLATEWYTHGRHTWESGDGLSVTIGHLILDGYSPWQQIAAERESHRAEAQRRAETALGVTLDFDPFCLEPGQTALRFLIERTYEELEAGAAERRIRELASHLKDGDKRSLEMRITNDV